MNFKESQKNKQIIKNTCIHGMTMIKAYIISMICSYEDVGFCDKEKSITVDMWVFMFTKDSLSV